MPDGFDLAPLRKSHPKAAELRRLHGNRIVFALERRKWSIHAVRDILTSRGLRFGIMLHPQFPPEVYLEGETHRRVSLSKDHQGPKAVLNALERIAYTYEEREAKAQEEKGLCEDQLRDYTARLGVVFSHEDYFAALTALRDRLKAALSKPQGVEERDAPSAAEIAGEIIALKQSQSEGKPVERMGPGRRSDAAVPITLQLKLRAQAAYDVSSIEAPAVSAVDTPVGGWKR